MAITPEEIGNRLRLARESRQITQEVAGDALGLPRSAISLMESGQRQVSTLELTRLADIYVRPVEWFVNPNIPAEEEDPVVDGNRVVVVGVVGGAAIEKATAL